MMNQNTTNPELQICIAGEEDLSLILSFIKDLAEYERLSHLVVATEESLRQTLFGERRYAEVIIGYYEGEPACFALFFHNYSTFLGKPGIYLEDLFVRPEYRRKGFGKIMLARLAKIAVERNCGRLEWSVLDWNRPAIEFYESLGAVAMTDWTVFRLTGENLTALSTEG
jgi:GNAT superfamily N-acetyltransferase